MNQTRARATREDDDRLLAMLAYRDRGEDSPTIGARFGMKANAVRTIFQRIDRDTEMAEA